MFVTGASAMLFLVEELAGREGSDRGGPRRIITNFVLYGCSLGVVAILALAAPSLVVSRPLIPGFGVSAWIPMPWIAGLLTLFLIHSFLEYWLHRASHHVTVLWRFHAVHHCDSSVDVSTAIRHHPLEVLPAIGIQMASIILCAASLGQATVLAVANAVWELATHAAIGRTSVRFPRALSFIVSPAFHRLHHSCDVRQTNSNYANAFAVWDSLFGTACDPSQERARSVGLGPRYRSDDKLGMQLTLPFRRQFPPTAALTTTTS